MTSQRSRPGVVLLAALACVLVPGGLDGSAGAAAGHRTVRAGTPPAVTAAAQYRQLTREVLGSYGAGGERFYASRFAGRCCASSRLVADATGAGP